MRYAIPLIGLVAATPANGQSLKPLLDARLRYEQVEQGGLTLDAEAVTLRVRAGVQASQGPLTAIIEAQGNIAIVDDSFDGLSGSAARPLVADPENIAIHRAQLALKLPVVTLTAGRQRITLDDERFVGAVGFRQNGQSFDGVRDLYVSAGWGWKTIGPAKAVTLQAVWHRYESDRLNRTYGDELNLLASAKLGKTTASVRFADYRATGFATDTRKFWLQLDWTL